MANKRRRGKKRGRPAASYGKHSPLNTDELVVFIIRKPNTCTECELELDAGDFLRVEEKNPLCLYCADLGHLDFLPRGDSAMTRRATKASSLRAIVVQWSRRGKRYERQGILVEPSAIGTARDLCMADEDERALAREKAAERRAALDSAYLATFQAAIIARYPRCHQATASAIAERACEKYSGRVGRSAAAKDLDKKAVQLAVVAHIRHNETRYDRLLNSGTPRREARALVAEKIQKVLKRWKSG